MTKLDKYLERETCIRYQSRVVTISLAPAEAADFEKAIPAQPERVVFHLKGTQQYVAYPIKELFVLALRHAAGRNT